MTILVTGGSGLVGSHVLDALHARGERVRALVRAESRSIVAGFGAEPVVGDVTDADAWRRAAQGVEGIVHAAALVAARVSYDEFERVNVGGTRLAIQAARREGARLVHVSTVAVYGRAVAYTLGTGRLGEDFPFQRLSPHDYYARTKRAAEQLVQHEAAQGLSAIAIRPNVIYGERDRLFSARVAGTMRRRILPQIGSGRNHLSCVYAGNVASAILAAVDTRAQDRFRAYNVTHDAPPLLTQREFFVAFARGLGTPVHFVRVPILATRVGVAVWSAVVRLIRPGRYSGLAGAAISFVTGENPYDSSRISAELGWTPPFDTATALTRTARGFTSLRTKSPGMSRA